jgi:hypothetical protein
MAAIFTDPNPIERVWKKLKNGCLGIIQNSKIRLVKRLLEIKWAVQSGRPGTDSMKSSFDNLVKGKDVEVGTTRARPSDEPVP